MNLLEQVLLGLAIAYFVIGIVGNLEQIANAFTRMADIAEANAERQRDRDECES